MRIEKAREILAILKKIDLEVWAVLIFMTLHLVIGPNRFYLLALSFLILTLFKISKSFLNSLWLALLAVLPFGRGRYYHYIVVPETDWIGRWDLTSNFSILFTDILLLIILYYIFTRITHFQTLLRKRKIKQYGFIFLITLAQVSLISIYFSKFPTTSLFSYVQFSKYLILFLISIIVFSDKSMIKKTFIIFAGFVLINSILVIAQYINNGPLGLLVEDASRTYGKFSVENPLLFRPGGFSTDPNVTATFFAVFIPIFFVNTIVINKKWSIFGWIAVSLLIIALVLTASRAAWFVTVAVILFSSWYVRKRANLFIPPIIKRYSRLIIIVFLISFSPILFTRLITLGGIFEPLGGGTYRIDHIKIAWHYFKNQPFGIGIGVFPFAMAQDFPTDITGVLPNVAHNSLAQVGAELGFIGLALWIAFIWILIRPLILELVGGKINLKYNYFMLSIFFGLMSFILLSFVFPWFLHPSIAWLFWILAGYLFTEKVKWTYKK